MDGAGGKAQVRSLWKGRIGRRKERRRTRGDSASFSLQSLRLRMALTLSAPRKKEQAGEGGLLVFSWGTAPCRVSLGHQAAVARRKRTQGAASPKGDQGWLHRRCALLVDSFQEYSPGASPTRRSEGL